MAALGVGVVLKQIVAVSATWNNCRVLHSDSIGIAFEVERTIAETGTIETAVSQLFVPWTSVKHVLVMEHTL
ncbi:MAG TPA: hypothetical protein PKU70_13625 [Vicinamibacteria bacterium]|jgi:hypothetical protein|nr:hypothetical protein [Vicinamibacteria bacterium]HRB14043.1 hypothetical protein [Vicinamibacteria bacterium]